MSLPANELGRIRWGEFSDPSAEQRYLDARGASPGRVSRAALWALTVPAVLGAALDWTWFSGAEWVAVTVARAVLVLAYLVGGLLCGRTRVTARLAVTFSLTVLVCLAAYGTIAVHYQLHRGRSDAVTILSIGAALLLAVHPGTPRRAAVLIPEFLGAAFVISWFMRVSGPTMLWNVLTIAGALACGFTASLVLCTQGRATYAINERLARSEAELRRMREAEARSAQRALARREDAWQALVTSAPALVLIVDVSGLVTFANAAAARIGVRPGDALEATFTLLPDTASLAEILARGEHAQFDARVRVGEAWRRYSGHLAPIGVERPHAEAIVVALDVTQSHELSDALHAAQKQHTMGTLAAGVAHDVNNLLAVVLGAAELSTMSPGLDARTRTNLESIASAVTRASRLTRQLLMFASRRPSVVESVDVNAVLTDLDVLFRRLLGVDVQFVYALEPDLPLLRIDQSHLEQVMLNLVTNARDAMGAFGTLRITTRSTAEGGTIAIEDSGCGMSEEVRARMFEPFFTTKGARGTGIGLATVARVIARFGGSLDVRSAPNVGTEVTLALQAAARGTTATSVPPEPAGSGCRVLLVDDEPEVLRLAAAMLAQRGYDTQQARSLDEVRARLATFEPDVLVTDVRLPGLRGRELAATLRALRPDLAIVFMSGCVDDPVLLEAVEAGEELLLDKPFTSRELVSLIERARKRQLQREAARLKPTA